MAENDVAKQREAEFLSAVRRLVVDVTGGEPVQLEIARDRGLVIRCAYTVCLSGVTADLERLPAVLATLAEYLPQKPRRLAR